MVPGAGTCCRLCLRTDNLISAFDKRLTNGYHLRMCVYLTAGVEIKMTDRIPKNICHQCCSLSVHVFQFRQIALANDKALKELVNQEYIEPPTSKEEIQSLTTKILENISQSKLSDSVPKIYKVPVNELNQIHNDDVVSNEQLEEPIDGSVKEIFQYFPNISVPKQILEENVSPVVGLDAKEMYNFRVSACHDLDCRVTIFKRNHSNIELVNVAPRNLEDSDSDRPVFKSKRKKPGYRYDDSGSDYDVTSDLSERRKIRPKRSKNKSLDSDSDNATEQLIKQTSSKCSEYDSDETCDSRKERLRNQRTRTRIFEWDNEDVIEEITRKKSPARCSDYDSDDTSETARKDRLRTHRAKTKSFDWDTESTTEQPIVKKSTEAYSKYCEYCDRYFWGCSQLKAHQRVHFRCHICRKGFESHAILDEHLLTVCYKSLACRKINIPVERVDQNVKLLDQFKEAFDTYFRDINDGVYGDPELLRNPSLKPHLYHTEKHRIEERKIITDIIKKFVHHDNTPITKNKLLQTRRLETDIAGSKSNQIVLDDIKTDVSLYKIPVIIVVDRIQSAHISFAPTAKMKNVTESWPTDSVQGLVKKSNLLQPIHIKQEVTENTPPSSLLEAVFKAPIGTRFDLSSKAKKVLPLKTKQFQHRGSSVKPGPNLKVKQTPVRKPPMVKPGQNKPQVRQPVAKAKQMKPKPVQKSINRTMSTEVSDAMKNLPNSVTLVANKTNSAKPELPRVLNISESVTLERNNQGKVDSNYNHTSQTNEISYPPRPSTAIRNILESISDEISIQPNYSRPKQSNFSTPKSTGEFSILQSSFQCLNNQEIKEELPNDPSYSDLNDSATNYSEMDYNEYPVKAENENCEMYQQPENPPDMNFGYPQTKYDAPQFVPNRPQMTRNRFDVPLNGIHRPQGQNLNPYQQNHMNFRMPNSNLMPSNLYQANQNPVQQQSRELVPVNSYNSNFMENAYERPYQERFNPSFNNIYQQNPYQNHYIPPSYNMQPHQNVQYNDLYQDSTRDKFVRVKQPWELYRR